MDVSRMVWAAAGVLLLAGCGAGAWLCHAKGLIGPKRAAAIAAAALCGAVGAYGLAYAFVPRVSYVQPESQEGAGEEEEGTEAPAAEGGRVSYSTAALGVQPAASSLPARDEEPQAQEDAQQGQAEEPQAQEDAQQGQAEEPQAQEDAQQGQAQTQAQGQTQTQTQAQTQTQTQAQAAPQDAAQAQAPAALDVAQPAGSMRVDLVGAACLVTLPDGSRVLVDAGPAEAAERTAARLEALGVDSLDALVLTGTADANLGGAGQVLSRVRTSRVVAPAGASGQAWQAVADEASRTGAEVELTPGGAVLSAGGCEVAALAAGGGLVVRAAFAGRVALASATCGADQAARACPGRADVLALGGEASGEAAREMWPSAVAWAGAEAPAAYGMARAVDSTRDGAAACVLADGSIEVYGE